MLADMLATIFTPLPLSPSENGSAVKGFHSSGVVTGAASGAVAGTVPEDGWSRFLLVERLRLDDGLLLWWPLERVE